MSFLQCFRPFDKLRIIGNLAIRHEREAVENDIITLLSKVHRQDEICKLNLFITSFDKKPT